MPIKPARVLAISDIHGDTAAVQQLRKMVQGPFDAVVVAGDIAAAPGQVDLWTGRLHGHTVSTATADLRDIFAVLASYKCPVCYIFGNHDGHIGYMTNLGPSTHHLQDGPLTLDQITISGFSGCSWLWDENPFYLARYGENDETLRRQRTLDDNRSKVAADIAGTPANHARLVVTHDRLTGCRPLFPSGTVFVHGHVHGAKVSGPRAPYRVVNPGSLFGEGAVIPAGETPNRGWRQSDRRWIKTGGYAILELDATGLKTVDHMRLSFNRERWCEAEGDHASKILPAEDFRVERRNIRR